MLKFILPVTVFITFVFACGQKHTTSNKPPRFEEEENKAVIDPNLNLESQSFYNPAETRVTDILHTKLEVRFDYAKKYMYGKAVINARPVFYPTKTMELDARGMEIIRVAEIKHNNATQQDDTLKLAYEYNGKKLKIDLGREVTRKDFYSVFIDYVSKPDELETGGSAAISSDKGLYFVNADGKNPNKPVQIWTQGETQSNSVWFPTIDRPNEKFTDEIFMTVQDKYVTLSNGILADSKKNTDGTRTDHWRMDLPHSAYLVMMAVGDFAVVKDNWRGKEVSYYVEKQFEPYARQTFGRTPEMIELFSTKLGVDYPWAKYAQICARDFVSGAMENTTATLHSDYLQRDDREYLDATFEEYISHELFHQWFGDLVTAESWSNLPLNESFATYGEYMWDEYKNGKEEADYGHYSSLQGYLRESSAGPINERYPGKREPLVRYYYTDREDMFDSHSYNKGGQVLHMLRQYVGDDAFYASLKLYLEANKFGNAEIHDLRLAFEKTTGQDLNWFFNQWFLAPGHPELDINYTYDEVKKRERVIVRQTQDRSKGAPVFRIPVNIGIYEGQDGYRSEKILVRSVADTFYFDAAAKPAYVDFDEERTLLCWKKDNHTPEEWAFLYRHSNRYVSRLEALQGLAPRRAETELAKTVVKEALSDKFWDLRRVACNKLGETAKDVKSTLLEMAKNDPKSSVRVAAIHALSDLPDEDLKQEYIAMLDDRSYYVISVALEALMAHFPETGLAEAEKRENDPARSMKIAVGNAYAVGGKDDKQAWFEKTAPTLSGNFQVQFLSQYVGFLTHCQPETVRKALPGFEKLYNDEDGQSSKMFVRIMLGALQGYYIRKSESAQEKIDALKSVKKNATGIQKLEAEKAEALSLAADIEAVRKRMK
jgi:aminopeptidase N